jgi:class 3 adenylate cyclase
MARSSDGSNGMNRNRVSVLVADVKNYSELTNDQLEKFFNSVIPEIADILDEYEVEGQNSWGDGIIAFHTEEFSAVECALDIQEFFRQFSGDEYGLPVSLDVRIALHSAWVWEGENPIRAETGFVGSDIALAARIEPVALPNRIFASEQFVSNLPSDIAEQNNIEWEGLHETELAKGWAVNDCIISTARSRVN